LEQELVYSPETVRQKIILLLLIDAKMKLYISLLLIGVFIFSCQKNWLDAKPDQSFVIPKEINEVQSLLDNTFDLNDKELTVLDEGGTDNFYLTESRFTSRTQVQKNVYAWASSSGFYAGSSVTDWDNTYKTIFTANTALQAIERIEKGNNVIYWNNAKGSALFFRAHAYSKLINLFCKPYKESSANSDKGLILKLTPELIDIPSRSTVEESYNQIISDLKNAIDLLPKQPLENFKTRPSKFASFALLSRVYLSMNKFQLAKDFADSALSISNKLIDYNTLNTSTSLPFVRYNDEVIFHARSLNNNVLPTPGNTSNVDTTLYKSYDENDLRKKLFFTSTNPILFKGSYTGTNFLFKGLTIDELYLTRAECFARAGETALAMKDLNTLLEKRWKTGKFILITAASTTEAITKILTERNKELCFRGIRWMDLRRLNTEGIYKTTLIKQVGNQTFTLPPDDQRYVYPIPDSELNFNKVEQNPR
jgi:tetratricopeptide (TPR) repeat protein